MIENKMDNRLGFEQWLRSNDVKKPVPNLIISAFDEVSDFAVSRKLSKMTVWGFTFSPFCAKLGA